MTGASGPKTALPDHPIDRPRGYVERLARFANGYPRLVVLLCNRVHDEQSVHDSGPRRITQLI